MIEKGAKLILKIGDAGPASGLAEENDRFRSEMLIFTADGKY